MTLRYPELKYASTENNNSHKAHGNPLKNETNIFKNKVCKRSHPNKKFPQFSFKKSILKHHIFNLCLLRPA